MLARLVQRTAGPDFAPSSATRTAEASGTSNGFCVASLVLGIIGLPASCAVIPPVLAVILGIVGLSQVQRSAVEGGGKGMAVAGIVCGVIGCFIAAMSYLR